MQTIHKRCDAGQFRPWVHAINFVPSSETATAALHHLRAKGLCVRFWRVLLVLLSIYPSSRPDTTRRAHARPGRDSQNDRRAGSPPRRSAVSVCRAHENGHAPAKGKTRRHCPGDPAECLSLLRAVDLGKPDRNRSSIAHHFDRVTVAHSNDFASERVVCKRSGRSARKHACDEDEAEHGSRLSARA